MAFWKALLCLAGLVAAGDSLAAESDRSLPRLISGSSFEDYGSRGRLLSRKQNTETLSPVLLECSLGLGGGIVLGALGAATGNYLDNHWFKISSPDAGGLAGAIFGGALGYAVGVGVGVILAPFLLAERPQIFGALFGEATGILLGALLYALVPSPFSVIAIGALALFGAILGANFSAWQPSVFSESSQKISARELAHSTSMLRPGAITRHPWSNFSPRF